MDSRVKAVIVEWTDDEDEDQEDYLVVPESVTPEQIASGDHDYLCETCCLEHAEQIATAWNAYYTKH